MESFRIGQRIIDTTENARGTIKYLGKFNDHSCHTIILDKCHFKNTNFQSLQTPLIKKKNFNSTMFLWDGDLTPSSRYSFHFSGLFWCFPGN